jgi:hypothetical protein
MTMFVGAVIIIGTVIGGTMLFMTTDRLDREIRREHEEGQGS